MKPFIILLLSLLVVVTTGLATKYANAQELPKIQSKIKQLDLPEEFNQVQSGDTLVIVQTDKFIRIWFYHGDYEKIDKKYLLIVK